MSTSHKQAFDRLASQQSKSTSKWEVLVDAIVRPPRKHFEPSHLGSKTFEFNSKIFTRYDYSVQHEAKQIELNVFKASLPCQFVCLYLHGNMSNRLESMQLLQYLPSSMALGCFDFMGCGANDDEQTISLGLRQSQQTASVCAFLREKGYRVILWGRSMGAATSLLYGKAEAIVADSAFRDFKSLCKQVSKQYSPKYIPSCLVECLFLCIFPKLKKDVKTKAHYNIELLNVGAAVKKISPDTLLILLSGNSDELINKCNSEKLIQSFPGQRKHFLLFEGTHNSERPPEIIRRVFRLLEDHFVQGPPSFKAALETRQSGRGLCKDMHELSQIRREKGEGRISQCREGNE